MPKRERSNEASRKDRGEEERSSSRIDAMIESKNGETRPRGEGCRGEGKRQGVEKMAGADSW